MNALAGIDFSALVVRRSGRIVLDLPALGIVERRVALVGRNGSGKSTLGQVIKGLIRPAEGTVRVHGYDPAAREAESVAAVGFLFQNSDHQILCPTVLEEIVFAPLEAGRARAEAECVARDLLDAHGVADWADRPVAGLSEGQRRLVCLLAVMVTRPRVLVLDEPYNGLDIPTRRRLAEVVAGLPPQIVLISHDPDLIADFDRVIWLEDGRLRQDGPPDAVLAPYLEAMTGAPAAGLRARDTAA